MARGIIFKDNGINELGNSPTGYKYVGYDGESFSEKSGSTVSVIGGGSTTNYTEYKSLLTQTGTASPIESLLIDTLSVSGSWSYTSQGVYYFTATGSFINAGKVEVYIPGVQNKWFSMTNLAFDVFSAARISDDVVEVRTASVGFAGGDLNNSGISTVVEQNLLDNKLSNTPITIRVWS